MSSTRRAGLLVLGAAIAVAAFLVLRPEENPDRRPSAGPGGATSARESRPRARSAPPLLTGSEVETIEARRGAEVRFRARSEDDEEVHVHGYDIKRRLPAGRTVAVRFRARLEGVFEIELERSGRDIARLKVRP